MLFLPSPFGLMGIVIVVCQNLFVTLRSNYKVLQSKMSKIISRLIIFGLLGIGLGSDQEEGRIEEDKPIGES